MTATGHYYLPRELARHASSSEPFLPGELRQACNQAGEGLGREDVTRGQFRAAAEMVSLWKGLDLPAWEAPYALRAVRLGYLSGFGAMLIHGGLDRETVSRASSARWGDRWTERLQALRDREGVE